MLRRLLIGATLAAGLILPRAAAAQPFPTITDRDFALDLYNGNALGSSEMVSMGGAAAALVHGSSGMSTNPASPAVRPATSNDTWDWDVHLDWLNPGIGTDFDNNGIEDDELKLSPLVTFGGVLLWKQWAIGATYTGTAVTTSVGGEDLDQSLSSGQLHLARSFLAEQLVIGGGFQTGSFSVSGPGGKLFEITATSLEAGALWRPAERDLRVGVAATLPATDSQTKVSECDPNNCDGLILPDRVEVPWSVVAGVGVRLAEERWNHKVPTRFRDEKYVLVAADVRVTGAVEDGYGIEAFSRNQLQPSGDRVSVSVRAGVEYEWFPGRLRIRGGSYWEPSRFRDPAGDAIPGRLHLTAGLDARIWQFRVFSWTYRLRVSLTADGAEHYGNGGLSLGFWH